jgi:hypothetical protein
MLSQGHPEDFNIEACWRCEGKCFSHIETGAEKQCNSKIELVPQADLNRILSRFCHIKREKQFAFLMEKFRKKLQEQLSYFLFFSIFSTELVEAM